MEIRDRIGASGLVWGGVALFGLVASSLGCTSSRVSDLSAYREIPMNRVVPFPLEDELRKRAFEIAVVDRPSVDIDEATLEVPRAQIRTGLEGIARDAGAAVVDPSRPGRNMTATEIVPSELDEQMADASRGGGEDYSLATRFSTYRYSSSWKKPTKLVWESNEDLVAKPGTCNHKVEVEFEVQLIEVVANDRVEKIFALHHTAEQQNKDLDPACTISPASLRVLFETVLEESLSCLERPLGQLLSPRGHVRSHRKAPEADRHIYHVSLGSAQGIEHGDTVEIRREQRTMSPSGEVSRSERIISRGRVTNQIKEHRSWVAIDLSKSRDEILEGDVVRPLESESLLASLSGPNCGSVLEVR